MSATKLNDDSALIDDALEDSLNPAKGMVFAVLFSVPFWSVVFLLGWVYFR